MDSIDNLSKEGNSLFGDVKAEIVRDSTYSADTDMPAVAETMEEIAPEIRRDGIVTLYGLKDKVSIDKLSDVELLSYLMDNGTDEGKMNVSKRLMSDNNNKLSILFRRDEGDLNQYANHLGYSATQRIIAVGEMVKRVLREDVNDGVRVSSSETSFEIVREMAFLPQEEVWIVLLNNQYKKIGVVKLTKGSLDATLFDVSLILSNILKRSIKYFIVAHNHPGGTPTPSRYDDDSTKKLYESSKTLGVCLLDHIIVFGPRDKDYYSYSDNGRL